MSPDPNLPRLRRALSRACALLLALAVVSAWHPALAQGEPIRGAFELLDADGDGRISREEFQLNKTRIFYRRLQRTGETSSLRFEDSRLTPEAFADADSDGDGVLSGSEWIEARFASFQVYDADEDQAISFEEFESVMRAHVRE